jgi:N utilization substance protein B
VTGPRRQARQAALQVLYFWEVGKAPAGDALEAFFAEHSPDAPPAVRTFAAGIVNGTIAHMEELDRLIAAHARNWRLDRLAVIDRLILRMAGWELKFAVDTPPAVAISEAVDLARRFGTDDSPRFVNGLLDGMRKTLEAGSSGSSAGPEGPASTE